MQMVFLLDADGFPVTGTDLAAPPVIQVVFVPSSGGVSVNVTGDALAVGLRTKGNQFVFTDDEKFQYNLTTKNFSAPGTYEVSLVTGDAEEYVVQPACKGTFVIW